MNNMRGNLQIGLQMEPREFARARPTLESTPSTSKSMAHSQTILNTDPLSRLPDLCKRLVLEYLPGSDVASLRLASRNWTTIAAEGLLNIEKDDGTIESGVFTVRPAWPNRNDDGLQAIAIRPWMAKHLKHLRIFTSDVDIKQLEAWVAKHPLQEALLVYQEMHRNALGEPWARWEKYEHLENVCPHLVNLEKVSIKSIEWPFKAASKEIQALEERCVRKDWNSFVMDNIKRRTNFQSFDVAITSQLAILESVGSNTKPLKALDIDLLTTNLFLSNTIVDLEAKSHLFARLKELRLGLCICTGAKWYGAIVTGLNTLLGEAKQLKRLDLKWHSHDLDQFYLDRAHRNSMQMWQKSFLRLNWAHVEELRLDNLYLKDSEGLSAFLCNHEATLKRLSLLRCLPCERAPLYNFTGVMWEPRVKKLLTQLRETLKLESFEMSLKCRPAMAEDRYGLKLIEPYVLGQSDWPWRENYIPCRCHW